MGIVRQAAAAAVLVAIGAPVQAAAIFSDRAAFAAAAGSTRTIDFEGIVGTPGFPANFPGGSGYYTSAPVTLDGVTFGGETYFYAPGGGTTSAGTESYILDPGAQAGGYYDLNGSAVGFFGRDVITIDVPLGSGGVGFDFGLDGGAGAQPRSLAFEVAFDNGSTFVVPPFTPTLDPDFFGVLGQSIDLVRVINLTGFIAGFNFRPYVLFDNVTVADALDVPEPATAALFALAFLGLAQFGRRRPANPRPAAAPPA